MSQKTTIAKNSVYNMTGSLLPIAITLVTVPVYISLIGESRYGFLALVWLLLGYFGLFDFGLGKAVANQVAYVGRGLNSGNRKTEIIFWTGLQVNLAMGLAGGALLYLLGPPLFELAMDAERDYYDEVLRSLPLLAASVPILTLTSLATGYFEGKEEFGTLNALQVVRDILLQVLPLITAFFIGIEIYYLIIAAITARLAATIVLFLFIGFKYYPGKPAFHKKTLKKLISYGGSVSVSSIIGPILTSADRFMLGALVGVQAVAFYTVPYNLATKMKIITSGLSRALFPRFSMLRIDHAKPLSIKAVNFLTVVITPMILLGYMVMDPFLCLWIDMEFAARSSSIGQIILMGVWINNMAFIPLAYLHGQRRAGTTALIHTAELIPYLALLWLMVNMWGVEGAAFAWVIRVAVDTFLMYKFADLIGTRMYPLYFSTMVITSGFLLVYFDIAFHRFILGGIIPGYALYGYYRYKSDFKKLIQPSNAVSIR
ncbi:MAG: flippase [Balneolales bacterium]